MGNYLVNRVSRVNEKTGVDCMIIINDNLKNGYEYDGKTKKFGIIVDNKNYIIKFAKNGSCSVYTEYGRCTCSDVRVGRTPDDYIV